MFSIILALFLLAHTQIKPSSTKIFNFVSLKIKLTTRHFDEFFLYPSRFSVRLPCKKAPTSTETTTSKPSHKPCWSFSDLPPVRLGKKSCCLAKKTHQLFVMTYRTMPVARTGVVLTSHIPISSPFSWYVSINSNFKNERPLKNHVVLQKRPISYL